MSVHQIEIHTNAKNLFCSEWWDVIAELHSAYVYQPSKCMTINEYVNYLIHHFKIKKVTNRRSQNKIIVTIFESELVNVYFIKRIMLSLSYCPLPD